MTSLKEVMARSCIRYLYERDLATGKQNPQCVGCPLKDNFTKGKECPLGPASPDRDPFASMRITKKEAIRRLDEWKAKQDQYYAKKMKEYQNG